MAVEDIRVAVDFFGHPKTVKLERRLGLEALKSLLVLWTWAAKHRTSGNLAGMTAEDIEIAADWGGVEGTFTAVLDDLAWLDGKPGEYSLHEWKEHNPWVAEAEKRSNAARLARLARFRPEVYRNLVRAGVTEISREEYDAIVFDSESSDAAPLAATLSTNVTRPLETRCAPSPSPSPDPEIRKSLELSTVLYTDLCTAENDDLLKLLYSLAPDCVADWNGDARWLRKTAREFPALDIEQELRRAKAWLRKRKAFTVEDPKGFFYSWLSKAGQNTITGRASR